MTNSRISPALDDQARAILKANDRGGYTVPTDGLYPYQWNWDSAFAGWGFSEFDVDRGWVEIETLFSGQWPNGMVPHILFHKEDPGYFPGPQVWGTEGKGPISSSGISQPPIAATMARFVYLADTGAGRDRLAALWPKLLDYHRWFMTHRAESGAVCITHPWEAGRDNTPDWDKAMANIDVSDVGEYTRRDTSHVNPEHRPTKYDYDRYITLVKFGREHGWDEAAILADGPFRVADPTMHFTLLRAHRDLREMGLDLGHDTAEIETWIARLESGAATLWNPAIGAYDARDLRTGDFSDCVSNASFLNWYAGIENAENLATYDRIQSLVSYGVPSHDPASPKFDGHRYWRGPVWGVMNTLIGIGLADCGHDERAETLRAQTAALIAEHGFAEYYDPMSGEAAGGGTFTWTAAIWLKWAGLASAAKGAA